MTRPVLGVVQSLSDPGANVGHDSAVDHSGCTINLIIYIGTTLRSAGPVLSGCSPVYIAENSGEIYGNLVHFISPVYAVKYFVTK
jgi:hypothetical protein